MGALTVPRATHTFVSRPPRAVPPSWGLATLTRGYLYPVYGRWYRCTGGGTLVCVYGGLMAHLAPPMAGSVPLPHVQGCTHPGYTPPCSPRCTRTPVHPSTRAAGWCVGQGGCQGGVAARVCTLPGCQVRVVCRPHSPHEQGTPPMPAVVEAVAPKNWEQ